MDMINIKKIQIRGGERGHKFKCVAMFDNGNEWTVRMGELEKLCEAIGICEDRKYPNGLGRNMFFLAHLTEPYKNYFNVKGILIPKNDLEFCNRYKIKTDIEIENLVGEKDE